MDSKDQTDLLLARGRRDHTVIVEPMIRLIPSIPIIRNPVVIVAHSGEFLYEGQTVTSRNTIVVICTHYIPHASDHLNHVKGHCRV